MSGNSKIWLQLLAKCGIIKILQRADAHVERSCMLIHVTHHYFGTKEEATIKAIEIEENDPHLECYVRPFLTGDYIVDVYRREEVKPKEASVE